MSGIQIIGQFVSAGRSKGVGRQSGEKWEQDEVSLMLDGSPRATILRTTPQVVRELQGVKVGQDVEFQGSIGDYGRLEIAGLIKVHSAAAPAKAG